MFKYCECGCGEKITINIRDHRPFGKTPRVPRFKPGHQNRGFKHSEETKRKIRKSSREYWNSPKSKKLRKERSTRQLGRKNPFFGKKHNDKTKKIIGMKNKEQSFENIKGEKNWNWKGGISRSYYQRIKKREKCEICGVKKKNLHIHHKNFEHFDNRKENLKVLCGRCHIMVHWSARWLKKGIKTGTILKKIIS